MSEDEIYRLAEELGVLDGRDGPGQKELYAFARAVQAKERELCAKVLDGMHSMVRDRHNYYAHAAIKIRAMGDEK